MITIEELQKRISQLTIPELLKLHELDQKYQLSILTLKTKKEIKFEKYKQKVNVLLIENGYETESTNE